MVSVPPILKDETPKPSVAVTHTGGDKVDSHSLSNVTNTNSGNVTITTTMDSNNDNSYRQYGGENCPLLQQETLLTTDYTGRPERSGVPAPATVNEENVPDAPVVLVFPILKDETSKPSVTVNFIGGDKVDFHFGSNVTNMNSGNITTTTTSTDSNNDNSYLHYGGENRPLLQQETLLTTDYTGRPGRRSV